jgi:hypothetical protein
MLSLQLANLEPSLERLVRLESQIALGFEASNLCGLILCELSPVVSRMKKKRDTRRSKAT